MSDDDPEYATTQDLYDLEQRLNGRLDGLDRRIDGLDRRLDGLGTRLDALGVRLDAHNIKLDAFWTASDRVQRLAFALLITAWAGILGTVVTVLVRR
ncbi:MAG TPA: hypothetical protein VGF29_01605 [Hyphomicrobiaceae bacterium]|jgi:hypothetical protein